MRRSCIIKNRHRTILGVQVLRFRSQTRKVVHWGVLVGEGQVGEQRVSLLFLDILKLVLAELPLFFYWLIVIDSELFN